jgi:hypothetical protein
MRTEGCNYPLKLCNKRHGIHDNSNSHCLKMEVLLVHSRRSSERDMLSGYTPHSVRVSKTSEPVASLLFFNQSRK